MQTSVHANVDVASAAIEQIEMVLEAYQNIENLDTHAGLARGLTWR